MPPLALAKLLHQSLPWLSRPGRAAVDWLVCLNGRVGSIDGLVQRLGLPNRFSLSRLLRAEGLPSYEELSGWVCVLYWMLRADGSGATLRALARDAKLSVAGSYRLVRRITGMRWSALRRAGTPHVVRLFTARCTPLRTTRSARLHLGRAPIPAGDAAPAAPVDASRVPTRIALPGGPCDVAVHPAGWAYVTRVDAAAVERVDLSTGAVLNSLPIGPAPSCLALDVAGERAYVTTHYDDAVAVIDTRSHTRIGTLPLPGDPFPIRLSPTGRTLYVTTNEDRLYALALPSGRIVASVGLPATSHHLALHPSASRLYVATRTAGSVLEIDTTRYRVVRTFEIGGWTQGLTLSADGSMLYVANEKHGVDALRVPSGQRLATLRLEGGACELALSPDQRRLYVALVHAGKVVVIDCPSFAITAMLDVGGEPRGIALDPKSGTALIANRAGWVDLVPAAARRAWGIPAGSMTQETPRKVMT